MRHQKIAPTGVERCFGEDEIIVSKTDTRGLITYANDVMQRISGYTEEEILGQPHNLIRHPDMPQCVFRLLWQTIASGQEIFAYVVNQSSNGDHYWVLAHVTPTFDKEGRITGYHSNRRVASKRALDAIRPLYARLQAEERRHSNTEAGIAAALQLLSAQLKDLGLDYEQFLFSLEEQEAACSR